MGGKVSPDIATCGLVYIGNAFENREATLRLRPHSRRPARIRTSFAARSSRYTQGYSCVGPDAPVTGNVGGVVEVVEDAELLSKLVQAKERTAVREHEQNREQNRPRHPTEKIVAAPKRSANVPLGNLLMA